MGDFFQEWLSDLITSSMAKLLFSKFGIIIGVTLFAVVGFVGFSYWVTFQLGKASRK